MRRLQMPRERQQELSAGFFGLQPRVYYTRLPSEMFPGRLCDGDPDADQVANGEPGCGRNTAISETWPLRSRLDCTFPPTPLGELPEGTPLRAALRYGPPQVLDENPLVTSAYDRPARVP
jgi:hypothetical protein